jgi:CheY-like chemotaxis protein
MSQVRNVLIVEDDRDTRDMLAALLATEGFHAVAAEDGLEALHLLRTVRHRAPDDPCLVLLDLSMPRLGGLEFRRAQLGDPIVAAVPIAVMSGASDAEERALLRVEIAHRTSRFHAKQSVQLWRRSELFAETVRHRVFSTMGTTVAQSCASEHPQC